MHGFCPIFRRAFGIFFNMIVESHIKINERGMRMLRAECFFVNGKCLFIIQKRIFVVVFRRTDKSDVYIHACRIGVIFPKQLLPYAFRLIQIPQGSIIVLFITVGRTQIRIRHSRHRVGFTINRKIHIECFFIRTDCLIIALFLLIDHRYIVVDESRMRMFCSNSLFTNDSCALII